jgi:hypothetical protein
VGVKYPTSDDLSPLKFLYFWATVESGRRELIAYGLQL